MKPESHGRETLGEIAKFVLGVNWEEDVRPRSWPPYMFALTALLLRRSGAYTRILKQWPPTTTLAAWTKDVEHSAAEWRAMLNGVSAISPSANCPAVVDSLWNKLVAASDKPVESLSKNAKLFAVVVKLLAIADEASVAVGLPVSTLKSTKNSYLFQAHGYLHSASTLTPDIPRTRLSVLPKQHTPRSGLTVRSMSHHLALHIGGEALPVWQVAPRPNGDKMNVLIAPWPLEVKPIQFQESSCNVVEVAQGFGCFDFSIRENLEELKSWFSTLLKKSIDHCGRVDAIVFPEGSLTPKGFQAVWRIAESNDPILIAGVLTREKGNGPSKNEVWIEAGLSRYVQGKHHRWRLDKSQIETYGLAGTLDPSREWWEHIDVGSRDVRFLALHNDLTLCCLVCEDLARQDPVAELVRSVGPNLVVALLADGPQIGKRWPARYATVLADDPGSSVLTVTSIGMCGLSKPPSGAGKSRSIALWKDAVGGSAEIEVPDGSMGVVLNLRTETRAEWTADGRSDGGVASFPSLMGFHVIK